MNILQLEELACEDMSRTSSIDSCGGHYSVFHVFAQKDGKLVSFWTPEYSQAFRLARFLTEAGVGERDGVITYDIFPPGNSVIFLGIVLLTCGHSLASAFDSQKELDNFVARAKLSYPGTEIQQVRSYRMETVEAECQMAHLLQS